MSAAQDNIKISVVIPCYNGAAFLPETIESVLAQTYPPLEILVIDDGSTDDSATIAQAFGRPVSVHQQPNQGESVARNRGLEMARGDWVAFLDADDVWHPEKLATQVDAMNEGVICIHTNFIVFGKRNDVVDFAAIPKIQRYSPGYIGGGLGLGPSTTIVRKKTCARFPTWTKDSEDIVFYLDLLKEGQFVLCRQPLVAYRTHQAAQTSDLGTRLRFLATMKTWLGQNRDSVSQEDQDTMQQRWHALVTQGAAWALLHRQFDLVGSFRRTLPTSNFFLPKVFVRALATLAGVVAWPLIVRWKRWRLGSLRRFRGRITRTGPRLNLESWRSNQNHRCCYRSSSRSTIPPRRCSARCNQFCRPLETRQTPLKLFAATMAQRMLRQRLPKDSRAPTMIFRGS